MIGENDTGTLPSFLGDCVKISFAEPVGLGRTTVNFGGTPVAFNILIVDVVGLVLCVVPAAVDVLVKAAVAVAPDAALPLISALPFGNTRKYCTDLPGNCIACN